MLRHVLDRVRVFAGSTCPLQPGTRLGILLGQTNDQPLTFLRCDADRKASDGRDDFVEVGLSRSGYCFTGCFRLRNKFDFLDHELGAIQHFHLEAIFHVVEHSLNALCHILSIGTVLYLREQKLLAVLFRHLEDAASLGVYRLDTHLP